MTEESKRDVGLDQPFKAVMQEAKDPVYLGDIAALENILRYHVSEFVDRPDDSNKLSKRLATILLGEHTDYKPSYRWNQAGVIDDYCATALGSSETTPKKVMQHCVLMMFEEVTQVAEFAGTEGVLDEEWEWKMEAVIEKFTNAFMGLSPATVGTMLPEVVVYNSDQTTQE